MPHPAGNKPHSTVQVISHRATSGAAPENTLAAVKFALQQDADVVENDIQRTTDGALVIVHDTTLARTTGVISLLDAASPFPFVLGVVETLIFMGRLQPVGVLHSWDFRNPISCLAPSGL